MHTREKYKLLAFISLIKFHRNDSCIKRTESRVALSRSMNISYNSFVKYWGLCKNLKLFTALKDHDQFISLQEVITALKINIDKWCRWTNWEEYDEISFTAIYEKIVQSIIIRNYKQQQYRIDKKEARFEVLFGSGNLEVKNKFTLKVAREAAREGMSFKVYVKRMQEGFTKNIVSGKKHVGSLLGYSASSGDRWLKKLHNDGVIKREIVRGYSDLPLAPGSLEVLHKERKRTKGSYTIIETPKGYLLSQGSKILLTSK